jgi:inhibitor of KinA
MARDPWSATGFLLRAVDAPAKPDNLAGRNGSLRIGGYPVRLLPSGDTALVVEFGDVVDRGINGLVLALAARLEAAPLPGIVELVATFRSLMIHYDPRVVANRDLRAHIERLVVGLEAIDIPGRDWVLPACYEGEHAPDLADVAEATGLSPERVVALHAGATYRVYCLGFLPGYPYMGETPPELMMPRRENPRVRVPMGSVCMAVGLTGVYSLESPGGWHLIARTPVRLFDLRRADAVLLQPGDRVRFEPISKEQYAAMDAQAVAGRLDIAPRGAASLGAAA